MLQTSNYSFVPSIRGHIKLMVVAFDPSEPAYMSILKELDAKLPSETQLLILTKNIRHQKDLVKEKWSKRVTIPSTPYSTLSVWVRDPFLVFTKGEEWLKVMEFLHKYRSNNRDLAEYIELINNTVSIERTNWFVVEGGNLLTDNENVFIGWNHFQKTMSKLSHPIMKECTTFEDCYALAKEKILALLNQGNAKFERVIIIGDPTNEGKISSANKFAAYPSPLFSSRLWRSKNGKINININIDKVAPHIDMFMSLTGQLYDEKPIVFVAFAIATMPELDKRANTINKELEEVVAQLREHFCIIRNPVPITKNIKEYTCFYNNCVVEVTENTRKVWIPSFATGQEAWKRALKPYDQQNQALWEALGFEAMLIESDFHELCEVRGGALHCLTNELIRQ